MTGRLPRGLEGGRRARVERFETLAKRLELEKGPEQAIHHPPLDPSPGLPARQGRFRDQEQTRQLPLGQAERLPMRPDHGRLEQAGRGPEGMGNSALFLIAEHDLTTLVALKYRKVGELEIVGSPIVDQVNSIRGQCFGEDPPLSTLSAFPRKGLLENGHVNHFAREHSLNGRPDSPGRHRLAASPRKSPWESRRMRGSPY